MGSREGKSCTRHSWPRRVGESGRETHRPLLLGALVSAVPRFHAQVGRVLPIWTQGENGNCVCFVRQRRERFQRVLRRDALVGFAVRETKGEGGAFRHLWGSGYSKLCRD